MWLREWSSADFSVPQNQDTPLQRTQKFSSISPRIISQSVRWYLNFIRITFQSLLRTSDQSVQETTSRDTPIKTVISSELSMGLWLKVETLPTTTVLEESQSMVINSLMSQLASSSSTPREECCPWLMLDQTPMAHNFSSLLKQLHGWMELMLCLESSLREKISLKLLRPMEADLESQEPSSPSRNPERLLNESN